MNSKEAFDILSHRHLTVPEGVELACTLKAAEQDLALGASMLAKQTDLARDAETRLEAAKKAAPDSGLRDALRNITHPDEGPCPVCAHVFDAHVEGCPYQDIDAALQSPAPQKGDIAGDHTGMHWDGLAGQWRPNAPQTPKEEENPYLLHGDELERAERARKEGV